VVDRAIIIKSGRIISDGPAEALHGRHDLWDWFSGPIARLVPSVA